MLNLTTEILSRTVNLANRKNLRRISTWNKITKVLWNLNLQCLLPISGQLHPSPKGIKGRVWRVRESDLTKSTLLLAVKMHLIVPLKNRPKNPRKLEKKILNWELLILCGSWHPRLTIKNLKDYWQKKRRKKLVTKSRSNFDRWFLISELSRARMKWRKIRLSSTLKWSRSCTSMCKPNRKDLWQTNFNRV